MRRLTGRERLAVGIWIVVPLVVWNLVYDLLLTRDVAVLLRVGRDEVDRRPPRLALPHVRRLDPTPPSLRRALILGVRRSEHSDPEGAAV